MVHLLLAVTIKAANTPYTGATSVVNGKPAILGNAITGGSQLYQVQNVLYFRTTTAQWSSTDVVGMRIAGAIIAPVATAQATVASDIATVKADIKKMKTAQEAYLLAVAQVEKDVNSGVSATSDSLAMAKANQAYGAAYDTAKADQTTESQDLANFVTIWDKGMSQLSPIFDGLISSGKAKSV